MLHPNSCRLNLMISDMDRSIAFYCEVLGMKLINRYGNHYAEVQAPDLLIGLHPKSDQTHYGNNISIGIGVKAFDETMAELQKQGIQCRLENDGWIRLAYFEDPDNNLLFLAENKD